MKKIMFNDRFGLTEAVLNGSKTQTRRAFTPFAQKLIEDCILKGYILGYKDGLLMAADSGYKLMADDFRQAYQVGEVVAIAQSYEDAIKQYSVDSSFYHLIQKECDVNHSNGRHNKMFAKAILMPHQIRITGVRIERLQDISEDDCIKEGVLFNTRQYKYDGTKRYCVGGIKGICLPQFDTPREAYAALIDKISGKGTWDKNPFVWVYDFELIK